MGKEAVEAAAPALRKAPSKEVIKKAMKEKAMPARGAILAKKAKAMPKRGAVKAKAGAGKVKAIPAAEFAKMAGKVKKTKSKEALPGAGTWYFMSDLRKMKAGEDDSKAWTKYDAKMNKQLEDAYSKGFKQYTMKRGDVHYIVKFKSMMQFRQDDKSLQRPVKRE